MPDYARLVSQVQKCYTTLCPPNTNLSAIDEKVLGEAHARDGFFPALLWEHPAFPVTLLLRVTALGLCVKK